MKSNGRAGGLVFDPAVTATSGVITALAGLANQAGGGNISANGTYYSKPSQIDTDVVVTEIFKFTGSLAGTLTIEISTDDEDADNLGTSDWTTNDRIVGSGFVAGVATLVAGVIVGAQNPGGYQVTRAGGTRLRAKLVVTSGAGTVKSRRSLKG